MVHRAIASEGLVQADPYTITSFDEEALSILSALQVKCSNQLATLLPH